MKILIAPNSFKECADSSVISKLIERNLRKYLKNNELRLVVKPISDGGDGFLSICIANFEAIIKELNISAADNSGALKTKIAINEITGTAFIESAKILGLAMLPKNKRIPKKLNSAGLGDAILFIKDKYPNIKKVYVGIGGTATNDMGLGALSRLGLRVLDSNGSDIPPFPSNYDEITSFEFNKMRIPFELVFVTDVNNPLLGENGATRIYGSQKGIKPDEYELFDNFFLKILNLSKKNLTNIELSGAGGGIPAGISLFYDVSVMSSKEFIIGELEVDKRLNPDVIITGEGAIDEQTFMEKGIGVLLNEYPQKKFFIITGKSNIDMMKNNVKIIELSRFYSSIEESIADYESGIQTACKEIADDILFDRKVN